MIWIAGDGAPNIRQGDLKGVSEQRFEDSAGKSIAGKGNSWHKSPGVGSLSVVLEVVKVSL